MGLLLDRKTRIIVSQLLGTDGSLTVEELSRAADISVRSTYYSLKCINSELRRNGLPELRSVRNLGISPAASARVALAKYLEESGDAHIEYLSPTERQAVTICAAYINDGITLDGLAGICSATKRTIQKDINILNNHIARYNVMLESAGRRGMVLVGEEIDRRYVVMYYLDAVIGLIDAKLLNVNWLTESLSERERLDSVARAMGVAFASDMTTRLSVVLHYSGGRRIVPRANLLPVEESTAMRLVRMEFPEFDDNTCLYAALMLMTHRLQDINPHIFADERAVSELMPVADAILTRYERLSGVRLIDREQLLRYLIQHLYYSRLCYRYGVVDINPLRDQVELEYPEIHAMTRVVLESLSDQIPYPITCDEVAYVCLLIGSNINSRDDSSVRVLVVCGSGISAAQMIRRELESIHPLISVFAVSPQEKWRLYADEADLIVSSVVIDDCDKVVVVHPVLTDSDKSKVRRALAKLSFPESAAATFDLDEILKGLMPYLKDGDSDKARAVLARVLGGSVQASLNGQPSLVELVDADRMLLLDSAGMSWEEAIYAAGQPLVCDGSIATSYLGSSIRNMLDNGDYSLYPNSMYLAHAAPESGVRRLSVSIAVLSESVRLPGGAEARFIVVLAPTDYRAHVRALTEVIGLFSDQQFADRLVQSEDSAQAYRTFLEFQNRRAK